MLAEPFAQVLLVFRGLFLLQHLLLDIILGGTAVMSPTPAGICKGRCCTSKQARQNQGADGNQAPMQMGTKDPARAGSAWGDQPSDFVCVGHLSIAYTSAKFPRRAVPSDG
jgi:hypothetical protein